jgi:hypothetical protein
MYRVNQYDYRRKNRIVSSLKSHTVRPAWGAGSVLWIYCLSTATLGPRAGSKRKAISFSQEELSMKRFLTGMALLVFAGAGSMMAQDGYYHRDRDVRRDYKKDALTAGMCGMTSGKSIVTDAS